MDGLDPPLPREWMDPAKRPPRNYLLNWQLELLNFYDENPEFVRDCELVFHDPPQNPGKPRPLRPFQTLFDFPPLPAAWKNPQRRLIDMEQEQIEILDKYDRDPHAKIHLFDDWEGLHSLPFRENPSRNRRGKMVGPSAQEPKKVVSDLGRLAGADVPFFKPEIDPSFRTLTSKGLRKEREERKNYERGERREVVPVRRQAEENCHKRKVCMLEDQRKKLFSKICSIDKMIEEIKQKLAFTE